MSYSLTPAASRALQFAMRWSVEAQPASLDSPEVLLGLLAEPECRAAIMLAKHGIDQNAVIMRWPELREIQTNGSERDYSIRVRSAVATAIDLLWEYPQPLELATEHLLLGLVAQGDECGNWLAERGFDAANLEGEIHRLAGHLVGPLEVEDVNAPLEANLGALEFHSNASPPLDMATVRILDAAANRASEGLRVAEDFARFVKNDRSLTERLKTIRHRLNDALAEIPWPSRLSARDTRGDVGTTVSTTAEYSRGSASDIAAASFQRIEQALRSLEEYGKLASVKMAQAIESLRYEMYDLHKHALQAVTTHLSTTGRSLSQRLAAAKLYVLMDGCDSLDRMVSLAKEMIAAGVHVLQLRDKQLNDRDLLIRAQTLRKLTLETECLFIMNDRPDLAMLCHADGVHVGQEELPVSETRKIVGRGMLVGLSTHSLSQACEAVAQGADYIGVGPTFPSTTKQFESFVGLELIRAVAQQIVLPVFAIGGIDQVNLPQVLATGCRRVAVGAAITRAASPTAAVQAMLEVLNTP